MVLSEDERTTLERQLIAAIWFVLVAAAATIAAAWYFQLVLHYVPCELCLWQRIAYYIGIPLALIALGAGATGASPPVLRAFLVLIGLLFVINTGLGIYHAGVEWHFWAGPAACGGGAGGPASAGDLLGVIQQTKVVSCTEAAWRLFGISMAGWNALISALLAVVALSGATAQPR